MASFMIYNEDHLDIEVSPRPRKTINGVRTVYEAIKSHKSSKGNKIKPRVHTEKFDRTKSTESRQSSVKKIRSHYEKEDAYM